MSVFSKKKDAFFVIYDPKKGQNRIERIRKGLFHGPRYCGDDILASGKSSSPLGQPQRVLLHTWVLEWIQLTGFWGWDQFDHTRLDLLGPSNGRNRVLLQFCIFSWFWQKLAQSIVYPMTHCSNPEARTRKKLQEKFEAAMETPLQRASKVAPTWYCWPLASRSLWP